MSKEVGLRIKQVRHAIGFPQKKVPEGLNIGAGTWQKIERGDNLPSGETLMKIAELGFNPGWILTGEGSMYLKKNDTEKTEQGQESSIEKSKRTLESFSSNDLNRPTNDYANAYDELIGRVFEAVANVYDETNRRLSRRNMAELASSKSREIWDISQNPDDWPPMVQLIAVQLKRKLQKEIYTDNSKASA